MERELKMLQPPIILVDLHLRLRAIEKKDYALALPWYQDREILKGTGSPDREQGYDLSTIVKMYKYLSKIGECYIIEVSESSAWVPIGDVTLAENTMPIVIGDKRFWGQGIGKRAILALLQRAKQLGYQKKLA